MESEPTTQAEKALFWRASSQACMDGRIIHDNATGYIRNAAPRVLALAASIG